MGYVFLSRAVVVLTTLYHAVAFGDLKMTTLPAHIDLLDSFSLQCSLPSLSDGSKVMSLVLKQETEEYGTSSLVPVASMTENSPIYRGLRILDPNNFTVAGEINVFTDTFLNVEFKNAHKTQGGRYVCTAYLINEIYEMVSIETEITVTVKEPGIEDVRQLFERIENQVNLTASFMPEMDSKIAALEKRVDTWKAIMFEDLAMYRHANYFLSRFQPPDAYNAQTACEALGGYLAEIDTEDEFNFVTSLVGNFLTHSIFILLGGTDEEREGVWFNRWSGKPLGFTKWSGGFPSNGLYDGVHENCQSLGRFDKGEFFMNDIICFKSTSFAGFYFLCEVPENDSPFN